MTILSRIYIFDTIQFLRTVLPAAGGNNCFCYKLSLIHSYDIV